MEDRLVYAVGVVARNGGLSDSTFFGIYAALPGPDVPPLIQAPDTVHTASRTPIIFQVSAHDPNDDPISSIGGTIYPPSPIPDSLHVQYTYLDSTAALTVVPCEPGDISVLLSAWSSGQKTERLTFVRATGADTVIAVLAPGGAWQFIPEAMAIRVGRTVSWYNAGAGGRFSVVDQGGTFDTGYIPIGCISSPIRFETPGIYRYESRATTTGTYFGTVTVIP